MKVGIVTYHNGSNYGAALQAFALQEAEKKLCNEVEIINYDNRFISQGLDRIRFSFSVLGFYNCLFDIVHFFSNGRKISKFKTFFKEHYQLTSLMSSEQLKISGLDYDLGVSGSDQIWNPRLSGKLDDVYFLNFGKFKSKISYASSFGNYKYEDVDINNRVKELLQGYSKVSTREKADKLEEIINRKVISVCDPTLLLNKEEWSTLLQLNNHKRKGYLLIYTLADMDNVISIAKIIAKERNLDIINIGQAFGHFFDVKNILDAGPKEFIELFYNADYVVTNSFHGTAFSVNFQKQFVSVRHPKSPERAVSFLKRIGMNDRLVIDATQSIPKDITAEEYNMINDKLNEIREESYSYLRTE